MFCSLKGLFEESSIEWICVRNISMWFLTNLYSCDHTCPKFPENSSYCGTCVYIHWTVPSSPTWEGHHGTGETAHVSSACPWGCAVLSYPMWGWTGQVHAWGHAISMCLTVRTCVYSCPVLFNVCRVASVCSGYTGLSVGLACLVSCGTGQGLHSTAIFTMQDSVVSTLWTWD